MKEDFLSRSLPIHEPRRAAAFSDPLRRRLILSLGPCERSVADLARLTGVDLRRVHYHVKTLLGLGLIVVARERARSGRAVKLYRAVARSFFVSDAVTATTPSHALHVELRESLRRRGERLYAGTVYESDAADGRPSMRRVERSNRHPTPETEQWRALRLSHDQAEQLGRDLMACLGRYTSVSGGRDYLVHVAIAMRPRQ